MATFALTAFTGFSASGSSDWAPIAAAWPASLNGDTGVVSVTDINHGVSVFASLVDDARIGGDPTSVVSSFDYIVTNNSADGMGEIDAGLTPVTVGPGVSGSGTITEDYTSRITSRALLFSESFAGWDWNADYSGTFSPFTQRVVISNFTVTVTAPAANPLTLDTIQPTSGAATGGTVVTLRGHGFVAGIVPTFDGAPATEIVLASAETLTCLPPPHAVGSVDVAIDGYGTLANAFTYTARRVNTNTIIAGSAPNLPPIPAQQAPIDPTTSKIDKTWLKWLNAVKQRVEAVVGSDASQIISGLFAIAQIPTLPWSKIDKSGSSLADLATRNAGDLVTGMLPVLRLPPFTGDVTSDRGASVNTLATVNANVGTFGSATKTVTATVNAKGLVTAIAEETCTPAATSITGLLPLAHGGTGSDLSAIAKGGIPVGTAAATVGIKAVGSDGNVLTADAASTGGVKWAAPSSGFSPAQAEAYISLRIL